VVVLAAQAPGSHRTAQKTKVCKNLVLFF
jgi:hypothetical protein